MVKFRYLPQNYDIPYRTRIVLKTLRARFLASPWTGRSRAPLRRKSRHSRESGNPTPPALEWTPAFVGVTSAMNFITMGGPPGPCTLGMTAWKGFSAAYQAKQPGANKLVALAPGCLLCQGTGQQAAAFRSPPVPWSGYSINSRVAAPGTRCYLLSICRLSVKLKKVAAKRASASALARSSWLRTTPSRVTFPFFTTMWIGGRAWLP